MILILDFEQPFDTIEDKTILIMLEHLGFIQTWIMWVQNISNSKSSPILLNGVPGKPFQCNRGVRQGNPLSPLLFVLVANLLQCIINKAHQQGTLSMQLQ